MPEFVRRGRILAALLFALLVVVAAACATQGSVGFTGRADTPATPTLSSKESGSPVTQTQSSATSPVAVCGFQPVANPPFPIGEHELNNQPDSPAIEFGFAGGNAGTSRVTIDATGNVRTSGLFLVSHPRHQLSRTTLDCLLRLAEADGFFSLPNYLGTDRPLLEVPLVFITIHTLTGTKTVSKYGNASNAAFDQLYKVLEQAVKG
jgi:hypothetical protein